MAQPTDISITIKEGVNEKTKRPWKGVLITVGEWSQLVFPRSKFEMDYIEKTLQENAQ